MHNLIRCPNILENGIKGRFKYILQFWILEALQREDVSPYKMIYHSLTTAHDYRGVLTNFFSLKLQSTGGPGVNGCPSWEVEVLMNSIARLWREQGLQQSGMSQGCRGCDFGEKEKKEKEKPSSLEFLGRGWHIWAHFCFCEYKRIRKVISYYL